MDIFVVYDRKAECVRSMFSAPNQATAIRSVLGAAKSGSGDLSIYPTEFELRKVGAYDEVTAVLIPSMPQELVGSVQSFIDAFVDVPNAAPVSIPELRAASDGAA